VTLALLVDQNQQFRRNPLFLGRLIEAAQLNYPACLVRSVIRRGQWRPRSPHAARIQNDPKTPTVAPHDVEQTLGANPMPPEIGVRRI
jgi:hypothetical protein